MWFIEAVSVLRFNTHESFHITDVRPAKVRVSTVALHQRNNLPFFSCRRNYAEHVELKNIYSILDTKHANADTVPI